jgi:hypothetical protein
VLSHLNNISAVYTHQTDSNSQLVRSDTTLWTTWFLASWLLSVVTQRWLVLLYLHSGWLVGRPSLEWRVSSQHRRAFPIVLDVVSYYSAALAPFQSSLNSVAYSYYSIHILGMIRIVV